jgi:ubiquinone/menaquinone biosynthesis C-methylase UbiE
MDYSTKISERMWNQPDKGELEAEREHTFIDDIVQKSHIEKELLANLDGIETAFDGGAGCGRFSILLAKQGIHVTHFDISQPMIDKAREIAEKEGVLDKLTFVKGALEDLSKYGDRSFDLVMSFDAPISYTYPNHARTIGELVRIAKKRIMISVSSRLGALPYLANPIQKNQFILDKDSKDGWVQWCLNSREQMIETFSFSKDSIMKTYATGLFGDIEESKKAYDRGETPWSISYHFMPDELKEILEKNGVRNVELAGPGAFARTIPNEILVKIVSDPIQRKQFLEFCHLYDSNPYVCGMGKDNLFAKGEIEGDMAYGDKD